jgi:gamma-glutamylcyclotransferase (GGCT)/AIG2-like uncharacterized protein YtfP
LSSQYLFVYGTLKSDAINTHAKRFHSQAQLIGTATWRGCLYLVTNYPAAVTSTNPQDRVIGELWRLIDFESTLQALDEYEECAPDSPLPHEYERLIQPIEINDQVIEAWIYLYLPSTAELVKIDSGLFINQNQKLLRRNEQ